MHLGDERESEAEERVSHIASMNLNSSFNIINRTLVLLRRSRAKQDQVQRLDIILNEAHKVFVQAQQVIVGSKVRMCDDRQEAHGQLVVQPAHRRQEGMGCVALLDTRCVNEKRLCELRQLEVSEYENTR